MSLTTRAIIAVLLMIGFYVLSILVIGTLIWIPYAELRYFDRIDIRIVLGCLLAAFLILKSVVPRRDKFEPPGPRITADLHPRLFEELESLARQTGQTLPHEVYLMPDVNAWVSQRGGTMGIGSRRVMGLGVPLMRLLTVSEFRAVLAHEFGHFSAGDTSLGPWIYRTRSALASTLAQLNSIESIIALPFNWYAQHFLRITLAISRTQEYAADRLGAQIAGANAMIAGLKKIHVGGAAWSTYFHTEVEPVLAAGFSPPVSLGLQKFLESPTFKDRAQEYLEKELKEAKADRFDSHPALPERLAALQALPSKSAEADERLATDLLDEIDHVDTTLFLTSPQVKLQPLPWEAVTGQVYVHSWQNHVAAQTDVLRGLTVEAVGKQLYSWDLRNSLKAPPGTWPSNAERDFVARAVAGSAVALALMQDSWLIETGPGEPMSFVKNGVVTMPFELIEKLARGDLKPDQWTELCSGLNIGHLPLDPILAPASTSIGSA
jgi:Zn-dependent protease with chaperone function